MTSFCPFHPHRVVAKLTAVKHIQLDPITTPVETVDSGDSYWEVRFGLLCVFLRWFFWDLCGGETHCVLDGTEQMTSLGPRTYNHFVTCSGTAEGPEGAIIKGSLLATEVQGLVYGLRGWELLGSWHGGWEIDWFLSGGGIVAMGEEGLNGRLMFAWLFEVGMEK